METRKAGKTQDPLQLGDTVRIKSGGPLMTVAAFPEPEDNWYKDQVHVIWYGPTDDPGGMAPLRASKVHGQWIYSAALERASQ